MKKLSFWNGQKQNNLRYAIALENIQIAAPCPASWQHMTGDDRVRHCAECKLNVYNLSEMTRAEAERLINRSEGRLCVRFYRRHDGTILTQDCPRGLRALTERVSRVAGMVLSAMMTVGSVFAQAPAKNSTTTQAQNQPRSSVDLTVVDPSGAVVQNATVTLCECKDQPNRQAITDSAGMARFTGLSRGTYAIKIQARGFKPARQEVKLNDPKTEVVQVRLQIAATTTTVEVTAQPVAVMGTTVGILSATENRSLLPTPASADGPAPLRRSSH